MKHVRFMDMDCIELDNGYLSLIAAVDVGPRILSLRLAGGKNLLAELPGNITETERHGTYRFWGGHRLWHAPEDINRTYYPDDKPVQVSETPGCVSLTQPADPVYGIEKVMTIRLAPDGARVELEHIITHRSSPPGGELQTSDTPLVGAPWTISMLRPGGVAILPQNTADTGYLANRRLTLWPYTDVRSPFITWGNRFIFVDCRMKPADGRLKLGFANPRGWLGCWIDGALFVKHTGYDPAADYPDYGASSQCYCCDAFVELETLGPLVSLADGQSAVHTEVWDVHPWPSRPSDEVTAAAMSEEFNLR